MLHGHVPPFCDLIFSRLERFSCLEASSKRFPLHLVTLSKQTTHVGRAEFKNPAGFLVFKEATVSETKIGFYQTS